MFISHFNRYFEKHAKLTYFVLLIIIIATFVIFVTPGSMNGSQGRLKDFGKMYGKTLGVEKVQKEMSKTTLGIWLEYPNAFGQTFSSQGEQLFQEALRRMRMMHYAKQHGLDKVADSEIQDAIRVYPLIQNSETKVFDKEMFNRMLEAVQSSLGLLPVEFDQVVRENLVMAKVEKAVREAVVVEQAEVDAIMAKYTLLPFEMPVQEKDLQASEEEIQKYFADHRTEIALPDSRNALAAVFRYSKVAEALGDQAVPGEEEISQRYEANKNTVYQGKTLEESRADVVSQLTQEKVRAKARENAAALRSAFQTVVQDEKLEDRVARFRGEAEKLGGFVASTGVVSLGDSIQGLGAQPRLASAIRSVYELGGVTYPIYTDDFATVAMVTATQPTQMPESLPALEGAEQDPLRRIVSDAIFKKQAAEFYQAQVVAPYNAFLAKQAELESTSALNQRQKQQALAALAGGMDFDLIQRFYVPELRSFAQVTFDPVMYLDQVVEPTEDELKAVYEGRKAEFGEKTFEDVRETLADDTRNAQARSLADAAATDFATRFSEAWWKGQDGAEKQDGVALMQKMAGENPQARFQQVEKFNPVMVNASNSELVNAVYKSTDANPVSHAIIGLDASYVTLLTGREEARLMDLAKDPQAEAILSQAYGNFRKMSASEKRAQEFSQKLVKELGEKNGDIAACDVEKVQALPAFSIDDVANQNAVVKSISLLNKIDANAFLLELQNVRNAGVVLTPRAMNQSLGFGQGYQALELPLGYVVIYVKDRVVPQPTEADQAEWNTVRDNLLQGKQNSELQKFQQQLFDESQTELRPGTPYTSSLGDAE